MRFLDSAPPLSPLASILLESKSTTGFTLPPPPLLTISPLLPLLTLTDFATHIQFQLPPSLPQVLDLVGPLGSFPLHPLLLNFGVYLDIVICYDIQRYLLMLLI